MQTVLPLLCKCKVTADTHCNCTVLQWPSQERFQIKFVGFNDIYIPYQAQMFQKFSYLRDMSGSMSGQRVPKYTHLVTISADPEYQSTLTW
jgi:hypothetical protein